MKKHQTNENWIFTTLLALTATSGIFLSLPSASADVVDTVTITVPKACSMSSTISSTHSAEINNGQYQDDIGETVIKATCNDAEGFSIYAIGFTDDEYGKNVLSSSLNAAYDIVTGIATSGNASNWAMKLSAMSSPTSNYPISIDSAPNVAKPSEAEQGTPSVSFSNYHLVPSEYVRVAHRTSGTDIQLGAQNTILAEGSSIKVTYQAYISPTQIAGTYVGQVKYTLVHPYMADEGNKPQVPIYMQNLNSTNIGTLLPEVGSTAIVYDKRDEQAYTIGKLADNKYWMLDNLALDLTDSTILSNLSSTNTNASAGLPYLKGILARDPNTDSTGQYATAAVSSDWNNSNSYSIPLINLSNKDIVPTVYDNVDEPMASIVSAGNWKVGGYYNYCAATAGSFCYGNGVEYGTSSGSAIEDICPAGWRLPTGRTNDDFSNLASSIYGSNGFTSDATAVTNYRTALRLPLSGFFSSGSASHHGDNGYWWSSTRYNDFNVFYLYVNAGGIYPTNYGSRNSGFSIRCTLKI